MKNSLPHYALLILFFSSWNCQKSSHVDPPEDPNTKGCCNFIVNRIISDDMILSISIDHKGIAFSKQFQSFENIAMEHFATVEIKQNCDIETLWYNTCNDVFRGLACQTAQWNLVQGELSFKVSRVPGIYHHFEHYEATVILNNATFQKENTTETRTFDVIKFYNVEVGNCPG